jgi:hypothetical protein
MNGATLIRGRLIRGKIQPQALFAAAFQSSFII